VRQQNKDWREGRDSDPGFDSGPSLRISAEPEDTVSPAVGSQGSTGASAAAQEDMEKAELERAELEGRLASMEQQVETLQRIVSLKDDQIAALQGVLSEGQAEAAEAAMAEPDGAAPETQEGEAETPRYDDESSAKDAEAAAVAAEIAEEVDQSVAEAVAEASTEVAVEKPAPVAAKPKPKPQPKPPAEAGGILSYLWYIVGALVLAVIGFVVVRRRRDGDDDEVAEVAAAPDRDVFADVELSKQPLELEEPDDDTAEAVPEVRAETAPAENTRGYGQRKHDQYASDVEANDALAEADIYIAYGRYPQAIDLIKNAVANEPANATFRLKLLQMYAETGKTEAASEQFAELERIGDAESIAAGQAALDSAGGEKPVSNSRDAYLSDEISAEADLLADIDEPLEADFAGLEIEEDDAIVDSEDELDLSADFDDEELTSDRLDEDLVIAAESNGLSTKLDLARAYMDMGDDDGARQILEEVAAEGSEELQAEARELLERIG
jgi:pilus assembly protein FimV